MDSENSTPLKDPQAGDPAKNAPEKNAPPAAPSQKTTPPVFTEWESKLAGRLGLSRDHTRYLRNLVLTEGQHWARKKNRVVLSEEGVQRLTASKDLPMPEAPAAPLDAEECADVSEYPLPKNGGGSGAQERRGLITWPYYRGPLLVWQSPRNKRIVEAYQPGTDPADRRNIMRVQVRDNTNFIKGMELPAEALEHIQRDLYQLHRASPRTRGRW